MVGVVDDPQFRVFFRRLDEGQARIVYLKSLKHPVEVGLEPVRQECGDDASVRDDKDRLSGVLSCDLTDPVHHPFSEMRDLLRVWNITRRGFFQPLLITTVVQTVHFLRRHPLPVAQKYLAQFGVADDRGFR